MVVKIHVAIMQINVKAYRIASYLDRCIPFPQPAILKVGGAFSLERVLRLVSTLLVKDES